MSSGPGKYDDLCTLVREGATADGAIVIVIGGARGNGFSVQLVHPDMVRALPDLLRAVADQIEDDQ